MIGTLICSALVIFTTTWMLGWWSKKKTIVIESTDERRLGPGENAMLNMGRGGLMNVVRTAIFSSLEPISLNNVEKVMLRLAERHMFLRTIVKKRICDGTTTEWFAPMEKSAILIEELPDKVWLDVMEKQLSEPDINLEEGPLWCVKFLPNINVEDDDTKLTHKCALIFVFNHAICDANSMFRLINETLSYLEDELVGHKKQEMAKPLPLPITLEDLTDIRSRRPLSIKVWQMIVSMFPSLFGNFMKKMMSSKENVWVTKMGVNSGTAPATSTVPMAFNKSETAIFMKSCKDHSVSPLAALQAAYLSVLADKLSLSGDEVNFGTTVNLRPFYAKSKTDYAYQQIASYISFLSCTVKIPEKNDFWTFAQTCKDAVHHDLLVRTEKMLHFLSMLGSLPMKDFLKPGTNSSLGDFNNCGNCSYLDRGDDCPIRVTAVYGCSAQHKGTGPLFSVHTVFFEKRFLWNLTYYKHVVSKQVATDFAKSVQDKLIKQIE